jgi:hypothetical protein
MRSAQPISSKPTTITKSFTRLALRAAAWVAGAVAAETLPGATTEEPCADSPKDSSPDPAADPGVDPAADPGVDPIGDPGTDPTSVSDAGE